MLLTRRWEPFTDLWGELGRFRNQMDQLLGQVQQHVPGLSTAFPPVNVWQDTDNVYVEAELPGMKLDDLEIYVVEGNQLALRGERKPFTADKGVWHRQERGFGKFARTIPLPVPVDLDKVEARFENGVLHVALPKSEAAKPRRITVKAE